MELAAHPVIPQKKPVLVCILDGWGENPIKDEYNACHVAATPTMDALAAKGSSYYRSVLAHGPAVGLPTDQDMGNSEVRAPIFGGPIQPQSIFRHTFFLPTFLSELYKKTLIKPTTN
jgi:bisphosphoglycerate-independent phosphoglycerate mutase (AlkP superfamily)